MFNEQQKEAIKKLEGRIRVIAGAGSGKTTVLTERFVQLCKKGISPKNILCVTFTNKAAQEMRDRISKQIGYTEKTHIQTFHSFCLEVLRKDIIELGYTNKFNILDSEDQSSILKDIYKYANIDYELLSYTSAKNFIQQRKVLTEDNLLEIIKNNNVLKEKYEEYKEQYKLDNSKENLLDVVYYGYLYYQQKNKSLDFTDLIIFAVILLKTNKQVRQYWQDKLQYIMVDEFQDASPRQYELVEILSEKHGNLFVVGDPDQTIYSWRGADPKILVNFDKHKKADTVILNENYRSTPEILDIANKIISKNTLRVEKDLFTKNKSGCKVKFEHLSDSKQEGIFIAKTIKTLLKTYKPKDIAVLYRMHFLSRSVEEQLIKNNIPYTIFSGVNFYERKEIKDVLAYLKLLVNPHDDVSFKRVINVPSRKIGAKKIEQMQDLANRLNGSLWDAANSLYKNNSIPQLSSFIEAINYLTFKVKDLSLNKLVDEILDKTGYNKLLEDSLEIESKQNIEELKEAILEYKDYSLEEYLQEITLLTNTDKKTKDTVSLMTIHSAKGLEFPVVFVMGMSEGIFPSYKSESMEELEEERRLAYVAYTRAKQQLILTDNAGKGFDKKDREISRFVEEVQRDLDVHRSIVEVSMYKPKCFYSNGSGGRCRGQYVENGHYYDWDDDTYLQGMVDIEDIVDACDLC